MEDKYNKALISLLTKLMERAGGYGWDINYWASVPYSSKGRPLGNPLSNYYARLTYLCEGGIPHNSEWGKVIKIPHSVAVIAVNGLLKGYSRKIFDFVRLDVVRLWEHNQNNPKEKFELAIPYLLYREGKEPTERQWRKILKTCIEASGL